jgi:hypothetical protein
MTLLDEERAPFDHDSEVSLADLEGCITLSLATADCLRRIVERARRSDGTTENVAAVRMSADTRPSPETLGRFVRFLLSSRRKRERLFPGIEFGEPVWDMMLDLYVSRLERRRVSVSSLCLAASVPTSTAMRWIAVMQDAGHFLRKPDPDDGRRVLVDLAPDLANGLGRHIEEMREEAMNALH